MNPKTNWVIFNLSASLPPKSFPNSPPPPLFVLRSAPPLPPPPLPLLRNQWNNFTGFCVPPIDRNKTRVHRTRIPYSLCMISVSTHSCCDRKRKAHDSAINNSISINDIEMEIERHSPSQKQQHREWAHMNADLLEYIQKKLPLSDILRCRAVCRWWRSVTKTHLSLSLNSLPKPSPPHIIVSKAFNCFVDVLSGNLYQSNKKSEQLLGEKMGHCVGYTSNGGYFLFVDREKLDSLYLFQPMLFSGSALRFPFISSPPPTGDIWQAVLWGDPITGSSYGIVVSNNAFKPPLFAKCGATRFTQLECRDDDYGRRRTGFLDIICVKNHIYGITNLYSHYFNVWDCTSSVGSSSSDVPRLKLEFKPTFSTRRTPSSRVRSIHLVESQGEILLVTIERPDERRIRVKTEGGTLTEYNKLYPVCDVYKMDFNKKEWVLMNSLGDRVLLVMGIQSISLSSHEFPQYQRNSVYYMHRYATYPGETCIGIFNMEDGSIKLIDAKKC